MEELDGNRILELTEELCKIPSVSGDSKAENDCAQFIYDYLANIRPKSGGELIVQDIRCEKDPHGRRAVLALYRSPANTNRTVLLTGHFDVVSAEVYGKLKDVAFDPDQCTKQIGSLQLSPDVKNDLESGNWWFGRGTMDMKYGLAMFMLAMQAAAIDGKLPLNLLFLAVPDEEGNSAGMRGSIPAFEKFISEEKLDVVAALSGEPCFITSDALLGEEIRPYWTGTIGKIMPFVFCVGKESHVNDYYQGFNAALLCAWSVEALEGAKNFLKADSKYHFPPPACLYMATLRKEYSVTLPSKAVAYFNVLTANASIEDILKRTSEVVASRIKDGLQQKQAEMAKEKANERLSDSLEIPKIFLFSELVAKAKAQFPSEAAYEKALNEFRKSIQNEPDERQKGILETEWLWDLTGLGGFALVIGYLPPYYPPRVNRMKTPAEKKLRKIIEEEAREGQKLIERGKNIVLDVFAGITDMSFLGFDGDPKELETLKQNMPGWGSTFWLPIEELRKLDIPVASMGPSGKDAHKATERLELDYSLKVAPRLLRETLWKLSSTE